MCIEDAYPGETEYRHSLREETEALQAVVDAVSKGSKDDKSRKLEPGLQVLVKLANSGLLASYVLLARPDAGIAQDYAEYRADHRDKLREYLSKYVVPEVK